MVRTSASTGVTATVPLLAIPALANTTSMPPSARTVSATARSRLAWSVTSASMKGGSALHARGGVHEPLGRTALHQQLVLHDAVDVLPELPQLEDRKDARDDRQQQDGAEHEGQALADG